MLIVDENGYELWEQINKYKRILHRRIKNNLKFYNILDFDGDNYIGPSDLEQAVKLLTNQELAPEDAQQIIEKVIEEADVDCDGKLSHMEFEHVITRAPEFLSTFHIRI